MNTLLPRLLRSLLLLTALSWGGIILAEEPVKREFRAVWLSTVYCLDWPTDNTGEALQGTTASVVMKQKRRLREIFDQMKEHRFNAIFFQVRPMSDALYKSSYEPTSSYLTGVRGFRITWDPLAYAIEEAHKRGLELHAWVNPYRWAGSASVDWNTSWDKEIKEKGWILTSNSGKILNPGLQEVEDHIVKVCQEIVTQYDVDGLVFDDYFYNSGTPEDESAGDYGTYKSSGTTMSMADWRRDNVNRMVKAVYRMVQEHKPYVRFGISPAGVASGGAADAGIKPFEGASDWQYAGIYSDPLAWLKEGVVDYISPQLYWRNNHPTNPFAPLTDWWSRTAEHFNRHHYASHSISSLSNTSTTADWEEYATQIRDSRRSTRNNATGCVLFRSGFISGPNAKGLGKYLEEDAFARPAIVPEITWKEHKDYEAPKGVVLSGNELQWDGPTDEPVRYSVYAIPADMDYDKALRTDGDGISTEYLLDISYENSYALPEEKTEGYAYAVCVLDKYGREYTPQMSDILGVGTLEADGFALNISGRTLRLTERAGEVCVYSLTGICVAEEHDTDEMELNLPDGIYLIKATSKKGAAVTKKLILH